MKNRKIVMQKGLKDLQFIPIAVWTKSLSRRPGRPETTATRPPVRCLPGWQA